MQDVAADSAFAYLPTPHFVHPDCPAASLYWPAGQSLQAFGLLSPSKTLYLPAEHSVQDVAPEAVFANVPTGHFVHFNAPSSLVWPAAQRSQEADLSSLEYLPLGHFKQAEPPAGANVPAGHPWQSESTDPSSLERPAGQAAQAVARLLVFAYLPAPHVSHDAAPWVDANLPAGHPMHPSSIDPALLKRPAGQSVQCVAAGSRPEPPRFDANLPAGQSVHASPEAACLPEGQPTHNNELSDPSGPALPAEHESHNAEREEFEYLPEGQVAQDASPAAANVPAVQLAHVNPVD